MINFLNLEYFLAAAEELNFTRAAKRLYISQQSLSNHISNMEKEFDVVLFNRTSPLTLTYAGQALKVRARQLLDLKDETYREIADIKDFSTGQLSIGVSHTRGRFILPEILPTYQSEFPGIELRLVEGNSSELARDLLHGDIDLMIDLLPFTAENVATVPICQDAQLTPRVALETENIETALALSAKGMGITFYPRMFTSPDHKANAYKNPLIRQAGLNLYPLDYSRAHGTLGLGYHKGHYMSRATHEFIRIALERIPYTAADGD